MGSDTFTTFREYYGKAYPQLSLQASFVFRIPNRDGAADRATSGRQTLDLGGMQYAAF